MIVSYEDVLAYRSWVEVGHVDDPAPRDPAAEAMRQKLIDLKVAEARERGGLTARNERRLRRKLSLKLPRP